MAGTATATYSADALTSPGSVDDSHINQWEYAVPIGHDVSFNASIFSRLFVS